MPRKCLDCTLQGDNMLVPMLISAIIIFVAGVAYGQENPRPGTVLDTKAAVALQEYSLLTGPVPRPSIEPGKSGNFIQVVRENGQPQLIAGVKGEAWLMDLSVDQADSESTRGFTIAITELGEFKYINPDRWTKLDTCSVRWVHDPNLPDGFTAIEVMPR